MKKNVLVISFSLRKGGNSELLSEQFVKGAKDAGHNVEYVTLHDKTIGFCRGCLACQKSLECVIKDDANEITQKMLGADVIAFATPIYYYEMCGQMKTMLDRANPLFASDYKFRDIYMLSAAADNDAHAEDGAIAGLKGWVSCFEKAELKGTVFAGGVDGIGAIKGHAALQEAYKLGKGERTC